MSVWWRRSSCALILALAVAVCADADRLNTEVIDLYQAGKYAEAIHLALQALAIRENVLGSEHSLVGQSLNNLAELYRAQGRYAEAEPLYRRSLANWQKALGPEHPSVATSLHNLGLLYYARGDYAEAEPLYKDSLAIREKAFGAENLSVATSLNDLGLLYYARGAYAEAEPHYKRSLVIRETALGSEHPSVATSLNNLAELRRVQGRYAEAEPLYKRSLAIRETALGLEHPSVATPQHNLAGLYSSQGRYAEAERLYKRSLANWQKALGPEHPSVATSLTGLAVLYERQGRYGEAEPLHKRSLAISEKVLGPEHPSVATPLNNLATLYYAQGRHAESESLFKRTVTIHEKALGEEHPDFATSLNNLAALYKAQSRYREAELLYKRSLTISEKVLGPEHPDVSISLNNIASLRLARSDFVGAADHWRRATAVLQHRVIRTLGSASGETLKGESQRKSWYFEGLVKTTYRLALEDRDGADRVASMFKTAQWAQVSEAAHSLAQMAARSASGTPELAVLARERQDLVSEWEVKDKRLIAFKSEPPARRNANAEKALADRLAVIDARLAAIDATLAREFPDYAALATPKPSSVADVQTTLRDDEALIVTLDTNVGFKPLPEETFVWIVTKTDARWVGSDLGTEMLKREVQALRCGLDATSWYGDGAKNCAELVKLPANAIPNAGDALPFDVGRSYALYKSLLGEVADLIKGKHLLIVPSGALTTLPFQVLVTEQPKSKDLASARWLIRDHAITVLPSVASLNALRQTAKPSTAPKPMIGFGNPLLDGDQRHPQLGAHFRQRAAAARTQTGCATSTRMRTAALRVARRSVASVPQTSRLAEVDHLLAQTPLPETAEELCEVMRTVGGSVEDVRLGARATETEVKRLSEAGELAKYKILHFATHGTLAGQLSGTNEPGLILTPPATATPKDDGYLSGSEIASLKLDADWVILSACNTAGGAGEGAAAEALSGLARVFFYAGARALLVSHWEVDSDVAVKLVTGAIGALSKEPSVGRAEALRRAMLAIITDDTRLRDWVPAYHPSLWAPFVVVGEGGAGR